VWRTSSQKESYQARFERATYALEEIVAARMCIYFSGIQRKNGTV
jgi:hypothetical protein